MGKRPKIIDAEYRIVQEPPPQRRPMSPEETVALVCGLFGAAVAFGVALAFRVLFYADAHAWITRLLFGH